VTTLIQRVLTLVAQFEHVGVDATFPLGLAQCRLHVLELGLERFDRALALGDHRLQPAELAPQLVVVDNRRSTGGSGSVGSEPASSSRERLLFHSPVEERRRFDGRGSRGRSASSCIRM